jgi:peptide-methionine (S)-S-oxide reductase
VVGNGEERAVGTLTMTRWARLARSVGLVAVVVAAFALFPQPMPTSNATAGSPVPASDIDESVPVGVTSETAVLAGGCFWGVQGLFQHVNGVRVAESGYAGGDQQTANYETVSTGNTGHAESVRIVYDPTQVTFGQLLQIFFAAVEDPDQLSHQVPVHETQYRSTIFAQDDTQKRVADSYIAQLNRAAVFPGPIVTTVSPKTEFFPAERYHQDFMYSNPTQPYIAGTEMPKLANLQRLFPKQYREQPVLLFTDSH